MKRRPRRSGLARIQGRHTMGMSADDDDYADEKWCVYGVYICMSEKENENERRRG